MNKDKIINEQLDFFRQGRAGCLFVAMAAMSPEKYGWYHYLLNPDTSEIDAKIERCIEDKNVSTATFIFPEVREWKMLLRFIQILGSCSSVKLGQAEIYQEHYCLGFRAVINKDLVSYVSGFGPFIPFVMTRRAPYTAITFRTKPRPAFDWVMKPAPDGIVHIADMDMLGLPEPIFKQMWDSSIRKVTDINLPVISSRPDLRLSAKTTFVIPKDDIGNPPIFNRG